MTDAEYLFRQSIREKKTAARGARAKVSGSKSKQCRLPSDNLTAAQLKRRNGPVLTYNVTKCLSYDEFKRLPDDLQLEYIRAVSRAYEVPMGAIAEAMGCAKSTMCRITQRLKYDPVRGRGYPEPGNKWFDFTAGKLTIDGTPVKTAPTSPAEEDTPAADVLPPPAEVYPTSGAFKFTGTLLELDHYLRKCLPVNLAYDFTVCFAQPSCERVETSQTG